MRTCRAALTRACHSSFGMNVLTKSGLNSASRSSIWTSFNSRGKLLDVHPFAWQASRLCVIKRTISQTRAVNDVVWRREGPGKCEKSLSRSRTQKESQYASTITLNTGKRVPLLRSKRFPETGWQTSSRPTETYYYIWTRAWMGRMCFG